MGCPGSLYQKAVAVVGEGVVYPWLCQTTGINPVVLFLERPFHACYETALG